MVFGSSKALGANSFNKISLLSRIGRPDRGGARQMSVLFETQDAIIWPDKPSEQLPWSQKSQFGEIN